MLCMICQVREATRGGNYCGLCPRPKTKGKVGVSYDGVLMHLSTKSPAKKAAAKKAAPAKKVAAKKATAKKAAPAKKAAAKKAL